MILEMLVGVMVLLVLFLISGDIYLERPPIQLEETSGFIPITVVEPMADGLIVVGRDDHGNYLHLYDKQGAIRKSFGAHGEGPGQLSVLGWPTWHAARNQLWVYDLHRRQYVVYDRNGTYLDTVYTPDTIYVEQFGKCVPTVDGFLLMLDSHDGRWNLGLFDRDMKHPAFGFPVFDPRARLLSDPVFTIDATRATHEGKTVFLAAENLVPVVHVFDTDLQTINTIPVGIPGWEDADLTRLTRLTDEEIIRGTHRELYSEIRAVRALAGDYFVVLFGNVSSGHGTVAQTFSTSRQKIGSAYKSRKEFVGGYENVLLMIDPSTDDMTLFPVAIEPER